MQPHRKNLFWPDDEYGIRYWLLLVGVPTLVAMIVLWVVPVSTPQPEYLHGANEFVQTGRIADTFAPIEYSWLCGVCLKIAGMHGLLAFQAGVYLLIVGGIWAIAHQIGAGARFSLLAAMSAALYPQLFASIVKVWDLDFAVLLMVAVTLGVVSLQHQGIRMWLVIATGVAFGMAMAQRPNMLLLTPLLVGVILARRSGWRKALLKIAVGGAIAAATLIGANTFAHGSFFLAGNGAYNLVQGHNEFSAAVMLRDQGGERSVNLVMNADQVDAHRSHETTEAVQQYFLHRSFVYMHKHPVDELWITAIKLWTFLRPNNRIHPGINIVAIPLVLMALVIPLWILLLALKGWRNLDVYDRLFLWTAILFVLPFLITIADPRYQVPLDIVLLAHIASLIEQRRSRRTL